MGQLFNTIFYQPILNLLVYLYNTIAFQDLGLAIILLTVVIKLVFWPLSRSSITSQKALQDLQPKIEELKKKHGADKVALSQATMALYKENKVNPFSSCLPLLIQLPFLFAVYRVFRDGLDSKLEYVYSFISRPETINPISAGWIDLSQTNVYLAVLAGLAQFWQAKMMISAKPPVSGVGAQDEKLASIMSKQMLYFMPAITVFIGLSLPGGLTLYWFLFTLLTAIQQLLTLGSKRSTGTPGPIEGEVVK